MHRLSSAETLIGLLLVAVTSLLACGTSARSGATPMPTPARSIVPWSDLRWQPSPEPTLAPAPRDVQLCRAADLVVVERGGNGATGWIIQYFGVGNRGDTPCLVHGAPGVRLIGSAGRPFKEVAPDETRADPSGLFPNWAVVAPHTANMPGGRDPLVAGQGGFAFMTYGSCDHPVLMRYEFVLSGDPMPVVVRVDPPAPFDGGRCDAPGQQLQLSVWPFSAVQTPTPPLTPTPAPTHLPVSIGIEAPATVARGSLSEYVVTFTNRSTTALSLAPCPVFEARIASDAPPRLTTSPEHKPGYSMPPQLVYPPLVAKDTLHVVNCADVGPLAPGSSVSFAMRIEISPLAQLGPATLTWSLGSGRDAYGQAKLSVTP
jgi:hypothetical protein